MAHVTEVEQQILEVIVRSPGCELDEIVLTCKGLSWNQVFLAIDRLSREGAVRLTRTGHNGYMVQLSPIARYEDALHQGVV